MEDQLDVIDDDRSSLTGGDHPRGGGPVDAVVENPLARQVATALAVGIVAYAVLQRLFPAPIGVLLQGVVIGGLTALTAFGLALVYRSNRIINFAQGDLGGVPAAFGVLLILSAGFPYFVAFPLAVLSGAALGAFVEFVFIRRFFKSPRLILTVVTIGVSQILAGIATVLPRAFGLNTPPQNFPSPFTFQFSVGNTTFRGNEVVAMLVVPVVIALLVGFFRYTNVGIAVRASAENAERASLLGVPVKGIQTIVWVVATVLATIGVFLRAGIVGLPIGSVLGPTILVRALTAAVIGRMEKLPTIFAASIVLGIIEAAVLFQGKALIYDGILFVIVLGALLFQRRKQSTRVDDDGSSWQAARDVRPIPRELANLPEVKWGMRGLLGGLVMLAAAMPLLLSEGQLNLAGVVLTYAMIGLSLVVLTGWAGQVSLGQVAFLGIGAAVGGYLTLTRGWDLSFALIAAGLAGALAATLIGLPALRIQGLFLAVVTLAFALATSSVLLNKEYVHWLPQSRVTRVPLFGRIVLDTEARYYEFLLVCLLLMIFAVRGIRRSRTGRVLIGVRENAKAAQSYGVNATSAKLTAFAISGFIAAFAGALFVHHQRALDIQPYTVAQSRDAFVMVVIGGLGSIPGAILGAVVIQGTQYFRTIFPEIIRPYLLFFTSGVGLIVVLLIVPGGFSQIFYNVRDRLMRRVAQRRGIIVPSLVA
ncbi:MAG: ABC transporter permease, partial [Acidimicrobiales bacterium]